MEYIAGTYDIPAEDKDSRRLMIENAAWKNRIGGVGTVFPDRYREYISDGRLYIELTDPRTDWKMWMKTIGILTISDSCDEDGCRKSCEIEFRGSSYRFEHSFNKEDNIHQIIIDEAVRDEGEFLEYFLLVLRKACFCEDCYTCESNCPNNCMTSIDGRLVISDDCRHCAGCHLHKKECHVFKSQYRPENILQ